MMQWKRLTALVAAIAISARPLVNTLLWLHTAPPDDEVGAIPVLSTEELSSFVKGKRAILIGGTRGVGLGTAQALAAAGARVTVVGRDEGSGGRAASKIRRRAASASASGATAEFVRGDVGTVCGALDLVERLEERGERYDLAVVSAAIFPDWTRPLRNEDGLDRSFAVAVVGRFLVYRNMHRFMNDGARILNVMASGHKATMAMKFDEDIATGDRNVTSLLEAMFTFGMGNEIMIDSLFKYDENFAGKKKFTMVSTHPGMIATDLHRGQGLAFDIFEYVMVLLAGISEEEAGARQSSILVSEKLHPFGLTLVDHLGHGRVYDPIMADLIDQKQDSLWVFLKMMERNHSCDKES